jgi:hypothetical protein
MLIYFRAFWNVLWTFVISYYRLELFVFIWYIFSGFGITYQEKSGNPGLCWRLPKVESSSPDGSTIKLLLILEDSNPRLTERFQKISMRPYVSKSGLPDFLRYKISMREKCTKLPQNTIPNGRKIDQTAIKYVDQYLPL